jgi:hypothetical protein
MTTDRKRKLDDTAAKKERCAARQRKYYAANKEREAARQIKYQASHKCQHGKREKFTVSTVMESNKLF